MNTAAHRIVIVGGGAGGLELATALGRQFGRRGRADIILVDACLTHIWKPLLHEVAAGTINSYEDELNYFAHAARHYFEFQLGRMDRLDRERRRIHLAPLTDAAGVELAGGRELAYDTLVIAVGSTANDFGTPGAQEHCVFLDSRAQADRFQSQLLNLYLQAQAQPEDTEETAALSIAIVGGGATGVELAAELHHATHEFVRYGLDRIPAQNVTISLVEAADRLLPMLPEQTSRAARRYLEQLGVRVHTGQKVSAITPEALLTGAGLAIPARLKVWSAGIQAPAFLGRLAGLEVNRINQLLVRPTLQTTCDDDVFAFGDCASCLLPGQRQPVPPRAQAANQQAKFLVRALGARLAGQALPAFRFTDHGSLVSLSSMNTVGHLAGNINIQGRLARLMYVSLYRVHQYMLHGLFKTAVLWVKDLLAKTSGPTLKLH